MRVTREQITGFLDKAVEWCVYVLMFVITFSNSMVEIVSTILITAWVLGTIIKGDYRKLRSLPAIFLGAYFLWVILSCFNSQYPKESFRGIFKALQYALVFMAVSTQVWPEGKSRKFLYAAAGATFLVTVNGIFQYITGEDLLRHRTLIPDEYLRRISSSFIHPNDFGAYLIVVGSLFVPMLLSPKNGIKRTMLFFTVLALALVCLFLTGSRGAWMSFAAAFVVVGILKGKKTAALFMGILVLVFILMPSSSRQRIYETADLKSGTSWERVMLWRGSVDMIKEHPVLGFGVNTFSKHFLDYKPQGYIDDRYAHNCYLQTASEIGIPGALLMICFMVTALGCSLKGILSMPGGYQKNFSVGMFGGTVGFLLNSAVDTHLFSLTLAVFFNIIIGVTLSSSAGPGRGEQLEKDPYR